MNNQVLLLRNILENPGITQREIARKLDVSLGTVNHLYAELTSGGMLSDGAVTAAGLKYLEPYRVDRAVILAAGFGSRFVPLTWETPKGLIEVFGERMVERQIEQLRAAGIDDIFICVGYMKEKFEYLIDKYGVKLILNPEYDRKNTISTFYHAREAFAGHNVYICNSDNWLRDNMYHRYEPDAWYSAAYMEGPTAEWCLTINKKKLITHVTVGGNDSWAMYGPIYFSRAFSAKFFPELERYYHTPGRENDYWEQVYVDWVNGDAGMKSAGCPELYANCQPADQVYEFENLEELRAFDEKYIHTSDSSAMRVIARALSCGEGEITGLKNLKAGMTNRSFLFTFRGKQYICRVPGEGTDQLVNRREEYTCIRAISGTGISENVLYYDPETGYKISEYYPDARLADISSDADMQRCMALVRRLHTSGISVPHDFDIGRMLTFYEGLCMTHGGVPYQDYPEIRAKSLRTLSWLESLSRKKVFAHIDPNVDNFLFIHDDKELKLIDWEYAGMADPLIDIAMCAIYSYQDKNGAERLLGFYNSDYTEEDLRVVYAYMSLGGLLWSLWAVYKQSLGVSFGEYTLIMYRYAKHVSC